MSISSLRYLLPVLLLPVTTLNAYANQPSTENSHADSLEKIQIRGIRGSVVESINTKRNSVSVLDAITAEDIGKFPDKNVAESLQRITGVSLTRVQGEGERVGVRGTAPSQNQTYINGQSIASADWWISSQPNRGFNYTMLPSELVSSLEVYKAPEADHDEGSLGGSINIKTRKPLETENNMFVGTAQMQYSETSEKTDPQLSLLYNWINEDNNFGALISLIRHERHLRRDGLESWGWAERDYNIDAQGSLSETQQEDADLKDIWSPGGGGSAVFEQHRIRSSAMLSLQYQPNLDWNIEFQTLYSQLDANNRNQNFLWQPSTVYGRGGKVSDYQIQDDTLTSATYSQVPNDNPSGRPFSTAMEAIWRESKIETNIYHLLLEHEFDYWKSQYQIGYTRASGGTNGDFTSQWSANTDFSVNTQTAKDIQTHYSTSPLQADAWAISEVRKDSHNSVDDELFAQLDFEYQLDREFIDSIKFGTKYKRHTRDFIRFRSRNGGYQGLAGDLGWTLADFPAAFPSDYLKGVGSQNTLKDYAFADTDALNSAYSELNFIQTEEKPSSFDITENSYAGYTKVNFSGESYRGNIGVRVVHTQQTASAYQQTPTNDAQQLDYLWTTSDKSYTDVLPSINIAMDWREDLVFRVAASKVMSRPEYHHLMPSTNYNVTQAQGAGGNPDLDPFRATKFDVGLEWYFDEAALFSIAGFQKDVKSFIDIQRYQEEYENIEMIINRPVNGSGGTIRGLELSWQQEIIYGLGIIANYTYIDGKRKDLETGENINIPGHSDHTANLTTYFENDWLSTRLSYNYRTDFATGIGEEISDDIGQLDVNLSLMLTEHVSLVFEGINLTDEIIYTYERNQYAPVGVYRNGRRFYAGARLSF